MNQAAPLLCLIFLVCVFSYDRSYKGHQVLKCTLDDKINSFRQVLQFADENLVDVWSTNYAEGTVDLNLSPSQMVHFLTAFKGSQNLRCEVFIQDLQTAIDKEAEAMNKVPSATDSFFDSYRSYPEIVTWLNGLTRNNSFLYTITIGNSTQGTAIYGIEMNGGPAKKRDGVMPTIYFQGGQHAREVTSSKFYKTFFFQSFFLISILQWISPATVCYLIHSFVEGYGKDSTITRLVDNINVSLSLFSLLFSSSLLFFSPF